ncbi:MAG: fimbrillin family protein [Rikenellaceae bacterium]
MKKYIIYTILAMATLASCQKYEEVDIAQSTQILSVSLSDDAATTRVSLTDGESSVTLDWESDDVFTIYTTDGGRVADFKYSSKNDDGTIIFASTDATTFLSDGVEYIAIYPSVDGVTTLEAHRAELESRLSEQTQTGNSDSSHLEDALRMEAEFTYSASSDTKVIFEHQMATMRLTFATEDGAIPTKIIFSDGDFMSYTVNFDGATEASMGVRSKSTNQVLSIV